MNCWFCSVREAEDEKSLLFNMYGEVRSDTSESGTKVGYNLKTVRIPRCSDCKKRHSIAKSGRYLAIITFAVFVLSVIMTILNKELIFGLLTGFSAGLTIAFLFIEHFVQKGIHTVRKAKKEYPAVEELLEKCYKFGQRPKNHIKESQEEC